MKPAKKPSYDIRQCPLTVVRDLCERFHGYKSAGSNATYCFAVYENDCAIAGYIWSPPPPGAARSVCPEAPHGVLALSRMVAVPREERQLNHISKPLRRQMRTLIDRGRWPVLITYHDEGQGHTGHVYKCSGWKPTTRNRRPVYETVEGKRASSYSNGKHGKRKLSRVGWTYVQRWEHWSCAQGTAAEHIKRSGWVRVPIPGKTWKSGNPAHRYEFKPKQLTSAPVVRRSSMTEKLIDAGRSLRGWSRVGNFFKCPQLYSYDQHLHIDLIPASALTRGSMGHVMQAHQHAIWGARQGSVLVDGVKHTDSRDFLEPAEAMSVWCDQYGGDEHFDRMLDTFDNYIMQYPDPPGRIVAVETSVTAVIGTREGQWGLWVVHPDVGDLDQPVTSVPGIDGVVIEITPLNMPGHDRHDCPIYLTRRMDLVVEDRMGRIAIWDHKHQANVQPNRSVDAYAIDGGFAAFRIMGRQLYGRNFGGLLLNLIQTQPSWKVARRSVPPTPHRDSHFCDMLWRAEHSLAQLEASNLDPWMWPKAMNETACYGRYGACSAIKLCFFGERGKVC